MDRLSRIPVIKIIKLQKMKTLFLISLLISTTSLLKSQTVTTNPEINKFVGVWRWTSGTDTLEITLEKQMYINYLTNWKSDALIGWHRYIRNGVLQQSSYQYLGRNVNLDFNETGSDLKTTLNGTVYNSKVNQAFFYTFWDLALHKNFNLWLTLLPNSTTQATWELKQGRGGLYVGPPGLNGVYSMPKQINITKL